MIDVDEILLASDLASQIALIGRVATRRLAEYLAPTGLTPRGMETMIALRSGSLSQNVLAETLAVHPVKLVTILNELERSELIVRRRDVGDRRRHTVSLSELGRARLAAVDIAREKLDADLFATLTAAQRSTLTTLLQRLTENLNLPTPDPFRRT